MPKALLVLAMAAFVAGGGCTTHAAHRAVAQGEQAPSVWPKMLAVYMPWFGNHIHLDVGYASDDPSVLRRQIQQARQRGISAFIVDWYGASGAFADHNFGLLEEAADENRFQVALLYNESEDDDAQSTEEAMSALDGAYKTFIGPEAQHRGAYLTYNGRPVIFIFPKRGHVDWDRVTEHTRSWQAAPLFIYKDEPPSQYANDFAGSYAWVQPGTQGWTKDGSNWGQEYLESFYKTMTTKHPDKIAVGAAWPGFDDSAAKWGLNRHMQSRCGQTFEDTLHLYGQFYQTANPLPFLLIETWNDYEEGTAIERLNFTNCHPGT